MFKRLHAIELLVFMHNISCTNYYAVMMSVDSFAQTYIPVNNSATKKGGYATGKGNFRKVSLRYSTPKLICISSTND